MQKVDLIIVGAGASGLLAAGIAAENGKSVVVVDKMRQAGRKLSITGKGRCNITNSADLDTFLDRVQPDGRFLYSSMNVFFNEELIALFNRIGIKTKLERGGRYFPADNSAPNVTRKLFEWCERNGVVFKFEFHVNRLVARNSQIMGVQGIHVNSMKFKGDRHKIEQYVSTITADKVLVCTGGYSYPATGSDGDGHKMLRDLGHSVTPIMPSLVPLEIDKEYLRKLKGLDLRNVEVTVLNLGKKVAKEFGELSFIENAITGPVILTLSRLIVPLLREGGSIKLKIDFKPGLSDEKLDNRIIRDLRDRGKEPISSILRGLMPSKLVRTCLESTGIDGDKRGAQLDAKERLKIRKFLKNFTLKVKSHRPFSEAIITKGGISTKEVSQKTMESKIIKSLYIAGEILDLDGPTGGYNLQIAFSTAYAAAISLS